MQPEKEPLQVRLPKGTGQKLKILAAKRGTSISALAQEAFSQWWGRQPEAKTEGPLFVDDSEAATEAATQEASKKATAKEAAAAPPLTQTSKKGAKAKK